MGISWWLGLAQRSRAASQPYRRVDVSYASLVAHVGYVDYVDRLMNSSLRSGAHELEETRYRRRGGEQARAAGAVPVPSAGTLPGVPLSGPPADRGGRAGRGLPSGVPASPRRPHSQRRGADGGPASQPAQRPGRPHGRHARRRGLHGRHAERHPVDAPGWDRVRRRVREHAAVLPGALHHLERPLHAQPRGGRQPLRGQAGHGVDSAPVPAGSGLHHGAGRQVHHRLAGERRPAAVRPLGPVPRRLLRRSLQRRRPDRTRPALLRVRGRQGDRVPR